MITFKSLVSTPPSDTTLKVFLRPLNPHALAKVSRQVYRGRPQGVSQKEWANISKIAKKGRKKGRIVLWRHFKKEHNEEEQPYKLKVVSTAPGDPLLCQLTEATLIEEKKPLMNAKDQWGNRNTPMKESACVVPSRERPTTSPPGEKRNHQVALIELGIT